jgi:3'-phosphoadenosine 5'-phosphosulfate (PAPS) 3'-phosphatase
MRIDVKDKLSQFKTRKVVTTRSHMTETLTNCLNNIPNVEITQRGGSGFKTLQVVFGEVECYLYPREGTKRWDTCAGEAIIQSLGGQMTDVFNRNYDYSLSSDVENNRGVVVTLVNHDFYLKHITEDVLQKIKINLNKKN